MFKVTAGKAFNQQDRLYFFENTGGPYLKIKAVNVAHAGYRGFLFEYYLKSMDFTEIVFPFPD